MSFIKRLRERFTKSSDEKETKTYKEGMSKTRSTFSSRINDLLARYRSVDEEFFEELEEVLITADVGVMTVMDKELEEVLITADVGVMTVMDLVDELKMEVKRQNIQDPKDMTDVISEKLVDIYYRDDDEEIEQLQFADSGDLTVYLVVGVNGVGKTTSIGKLAYRLKQEGKEVVRSEEHTSELQSRGHLVCRLLL